MGEGGGVDVTRQSQTHFIIDIPLSLFSLIPLTSTLNVTYVVTFLLPAYRIFTIHFEPAD